VDDEKDSAVFRALGESVRLKILARLAGGELCACDLLATLEISQSTLSHHMKVLTEAGLVDGRRKGVWVHYSLRAGGLADLLDRLASLDDPEEASAGKTRPATCCGAEESA